MARVHGYVLTIKMFVPVDRTNLSDTIAKAQAVQEAQSKGDLSGLTKARVLNFKQRFTSQAEEDPQLDLEDAAPLGVSHGESGEHVDIVIAQNATDPVEPEAGKADTPIDQRPESRRKTAA